MRVLIACLLAVAVAAKQRVKFFEGPSYNVATREEAINVCQSMNMHIAHESQLILDIDEGYSGHAKCGWTWSRGRRVHVHCKEKDDDGVKCKPGKSELRPCAVQEGTFQAAPSGVYCRVFSDQAERGRFIVEEGELVEIYRAQGPDGPNTIMNVNEARAVCEGEGNILAYWTHVATYVDRYGIQICQFSWLREQNAVYNANCKHNDEIQWQIRDRSRGYDAICHGSVPHAYRDPCVNSFEFKNLEGVPIYCSDDGYIIVQDRPPCYKEEYTFKQEWAQYRKGFGEVGKGYWLGLEVLAKLTKSYNFELVIELVGDDGKSYTARYDRFSVGSLEDQYRLRVSGYSGNAGDMFNEIQSNSLTSNGAQFSTYKHDNDGSDGYNCAREYASGWWFQSCHLDNLNGPCSGEDAYSESIAATRTWRSVSNGTPGLRSTRMKIKFVSDDRVDQARIEAQKKSSSD